MDYDVLAFIGRFQPFHHGHKAVVDQALARAKKVALIIGSHDQPRTARNPFTTAERIAMISAVYPEEVASGRLHFAPQVDHAYSDDRWRAGIQSSVSAIANTPFTPDPVKIGLIGHSKDHTSYYLKSFPTWDSIEVDNVAGLNATDIRKEMFGWNGLLPVATGEKFMPKAVGDYIRAWAGINEASASFTQVDEEAKFIDNYKRQWNRAPYPPTFVTADAVVIQSGHILLIKRKETPGKGLWALPGGFLDQNERIVDGVLRELREETRIALQDDTLRECIQRIEVFDAPNRSQRGRTITHAALIRLRDDKKLVKVKGSDDAEKARWVPLADLRREMFFEDHYDIIETMVGL